MRVRLDSTDPELGLVRLCNGCGETWPKDAEFFYFSRDGNVMGDCRACWADRSRIRAATGPDFIFRAWQKTRA